VTCQLARQADEQLTNLNAAMFDLGADRKFQCNMTRVARPRRIARRYRSTRERNSSKIRHSTFPRLRPTSSSGVIQDAGADV
jgi:hypothetical protein